MIVRNPNLKRYKKTTQKMSAVQFVNSNAQVLKKVAALAVNINAAKGLQEVMKTNLGPKGTLKM